MKNTNGDIILDCWSCAHSQSGVWLPSQERWLVCALTLLNAREIAHDVAAQRISEGGSGVVPL